VTTGDSETACQLRVPQIGKCDNGSFEKQFPRAGTIGEIGVLVIEERSVEMGAVKRLGLGLVGASIGLAIFLQIRTWHEPLWQWNLDDANRSEETTVYQQNLSGQRKLWLIDGVSFAAGLLLTVAGYDLEKRQERRKLRNQAMQDSLKRIEGVGM
jgi:hypothetical protein